MKRNNTALRFWVESYYDYQKQRIMTGNRIGNIVYRTLEPETWQKKKERSEKSYGVNYNFDEVKKKYKINLDKFPIEQQQEVEAMFDFMDESKKFEKTCSKWVEFIVKDEPIFVDFLQDIKGISYILAGGLIAWIQDISRFATVSSLWAYSGLSAEYTIANCTNGHKLMLASYKEGMECRHLNCGGEVIFLERVKEVPKLKPGYSSFWNKKLKTHMWKIGESFIKQKSFYRDLYDKYREREDKNNPEMSKLHRKNRASRKVVKIFLSHLWVRWRELEDLPVSKPYCEAYLNHKCIEHRSNEN